MKKIIFMLFCMVLLLGCNKTNYYDSAISEDITETKFFYSDEIKYYFMANHITDSKYDILKECESAALYKNYIYCVKNAALYRYDLDMNNEKRIFDLKGYGIDFIYDNKIFAFKTGMFKSIACYSIDMETGKKEKLFSARNMVPEFVYRDKLYFWRIFNGNDIENMEVKIYAYDLNTKDISLIYEQGENDCEWYYYNGSLLVDTYEGLAKSINLDTYEESSIEFLNDAEVIYCKNNEIVYYKDGIYYLRRSDESIRLFDGKEDNFVYFIDGNIVIYREYADIEFWGNGEYNVYSYDIKTCTREELETGVKYDVNDFLLN